jgi:uncharacterized damage-inducible protein DinB
VSQPATGTETGALLSSLNAQRRHVLGIVADLSDDALRRPVLPSGWTCLGMVRHLTLDVERFWFRGVVAGEPINLDETDDAIWNVCAELSAAAVFDEYRQETEHANAVIAATAADAAPVWWPEELFPGFRLHTLREIVLHVITETACHAGHLDAVRELIDGRTWLVLTE